MDYSVEAAKNNISEISSIVQKKLDSQPGTMNIIELMNRNHLENQHSNVLAYLINPLEGHKHEEYGKSFIRLLNSKFEKQIDENIVLVRREDPTVEKRRIDILIKTEEAFVIIENKIYAEDQPEQMIDYVDDILGRDEEGDKSRLIFCVYLTPTEKEISLDSLSEEERKSISQIGGYINITYKNDILPWIDSLSVNKDEEVLKSALIQYKDILEGITGKRIIADRKKLFNEEIIKSYFIQGNKKELMDLHKRFQAVGLENEYEKWFVEESLRIPVYMNFILEVLKQINSFPEDYKKFYLFCKDNSFPVDKVAEWAECVGKEQVDFGLEWQSSAPDVKMYFMFSNAGSTSACCGVKYIKENKTEDYLNLEYVNKQLLQTWKYKEDLAFVVANNAFLKRIKAMKDKSVKQQA